MARRSVQAAGGALLRVHPLPSSGQYGQCNSFPSKSDGQVQWKPQDVPSQSHSGRQEILWRQFFLDPTLWWDNRQEKMSSRSPDFRHKESKEPLWLDNLYKPAWVDAQLTMLDAWIGGPATPTSSSTRSNDPGPPTGAEYEGDVITPETVIKLCEKGLLTEAVDALGVLVKKESRVFPSLFYNVLKRCVARKNMVLGRRVHDLTVKIGYDSNTFLANHILRMYAFEGMLQEAMDVFTRVATPDAFMWCSIISAHAKHGEHKQAIQLYHEMRRSSMKPDSHVFVAALQACATAADLESGRQVHADVLASGVPANTFVCTCLVDMYAKCGKFEDACKVFDGMPARDVVAWNAMIAGYAEHGLGQEALAVYGRMEQEGLVVADTVTFASLLKACASAGALQQGKQLHSEILKRGLDADILVGSCLVEMFAKCGRLEDARSFFDSLPKKNVVTWTALINGYGQTSEGCKAIDCFQEMLQNGIKPDETTFTCLLVACCHVGLVNEGRKYFSVMVEKFGIMPTIEHYTCMVDLLGRAGHLDEAKNMLLSFERDNVGLMSLLNACKSHGDIECAKWCFESLVRLDPQNAAAYVLMANTYADAGMWTDVDRIEELRKSAGASKKPAIAGIEVNRQVHTFVVGEKREDISSKVRSLNLCLEKGGHVPNTELVLKPLADKEKEDELCGHAEKLALAYGLLNTPDGTPLLVTKNLRMCMDCHRSTEIMSRTEQREIIVRDAHRVHQFVGGSCCCGGRP